MNIIIPMCTCLRCGKVWAPRKKNVRVCPRCHSPYFDVPKKEKETKGE